MNLKERMNKAKEDDLNRIRGLGVKKVKLLCAGDERDCAWCKSVSGKEHSSSKDILALIEKNCTCESHCRCVVQAVIKL